MDTITKETLKKTFLSEYSNCCVSLFMPTHRAGRETEQDPIRFKNLLREVEERLLTNGLRSTDVREILKGPQLLLQDPMFWHYQSDGLAMFFTIERLEFFRLPLAFVELVVISNRFHVKPLLPLFNSDGHFYVLALSQNGVRLLEGTRDTVDEVDLATVPKSLAEAFYSEPSDKQLQFHTGTPSGAGMRPAMFHGHDNSNESKVRILQWFRMIDKELSNIFVGGKSPLVLAGVESLLSLYKEANAYPHLVDHGILGNPEDLQPEELHGHAWTLVQPIFVEARQRAAAHYMRLAATGQTTTDVREAVPAAYHGKVDVLFVAVGVQVWGHYDPDTNVVDVHDTPEPGDEDLLDLAAIHTLLNVGVVYALEPCEVPDHGHLAAVYRY
ncbi:MAG: hypothetical protein AB2L11_06365 [Syntrophobacteraceae bacterium]